MTLIAGVKTPYGVAVAADTRIMQDHLITQPARKILQTDGGDAAIAIAGELRLINAVKEAKDDVLDCLRQNGISKTVSLLRDIVQRDGAKPSEGRRGSLSYPCEFIVAAPSLLWSVGQDFAYSEVQAPWDLVAHGYGAEVAMGAWRGMSCVASLAGDGFFNPQNSIATEKRLADVFAITANYVVSCGADYDVVWVGNAPQPT